ncbi:DUF2255 family protein [Tropicibacter naphthalenivorans]|uniref:DUF2255 domain-containing protein n=1 Tax=Tropicibacter naphthalenivorans TaxID=441103 RepID=A0A0N7M0S4_9RHOB|nr:DUF2255 family protein [Tropicibacter naphthalenivorans]CUH81273.1 hypothetical protein TRN7648_03397 [Tropicibacter naphthalenivorans]SMC98062.1 hypothetical protein SAMN04488093_108101 [Tropicibacter naphthalenivorans]
MSQMHWTKSQLAAFAPADDFHVAPFRAEGVTYGTPTFIWSVVVQGRLFVRAYSGVGSSWYRAAVAQGAGRIVLTGRSLKVDFAPVGGEILDAIDEAYREKYASSRYLKPMISERARAATVEVTPIDPYR